MPNQQQPDEKKTALPEENKIAPPKEGIVEKKESTSLTSEPVPAPTGEVGGKPEPEAEQKTQQMPEAEPVPVPILEPEKEPGQEKGSEIKEILAQKKEDVQKAVSKSGGKDDNSKDDDDEKKKIDEYANSIAKIEDVEEQIKKLVELAQHKDPILAVKVASHMDNYVLDAVHDKLLEDEVKKILVEKGLLKEI